MHPEVTQRKRATSRRWYIGSFGLLTVLFLAVIALVPQASTHAAGNGQIDVLYANYNPTPLTATQAQPTFDVVNGTASGINLSNFTIRYWFTEEGTQPLVFDCYYAQVGCNNITYKFVAFPTAAPGADHYLEVGFSASLANLSPGTDTGQIQVAFHKADRSLFNQTNDFSWNPNITSLNSDQTNARSTLIDQGFIVDGPLPLADGTTRATVDESNFPASSLGTIDLGINTPVYNNHFLDPTIATTFNANQISLPTQPGGTASLQHGSGTSIFRFPGGGTADVYHWSTNTVGNPGGANGTLSPIGITNPFTAQAYQLPLDPSTGQPYLLSFADQFMNFDAYMAQVAAMGADTHTEADIVVNYGSSTPQDAADWVRYANKGVIPVDGTQQALDAATAAFKASGGFQPHYQRGFLGKPNGNRYGIQYWEIGNEVYGDGSYTAPFEYIDPTKRPEGGPAAYAQGVIDYSSAMKHIDGSIKIGAVFTMPGNNPDDLTIGGLKYANGKPVLPWDDTLLHAKDQKDPTKTFCDAIDFASVHWYPQQPLHPSGIPETDQQLMQAPLSGSPTSPSIPDMASKLRSRINGACGTARGNQIKIQVTEMNSVAYNPGKQTTGPYNPLFLAHALQTWADNSKQYGITAVYPWDMFNSVSTHDFFHPENKANNDQSLLGLRNYGNFGLFSSGPTDIEKDVIQGTTFQNPDALDQPYPSFSGIQMFHFLQGATGGNALLTSAPDGPDSNDIFVHAVIRSDGTIAIMVINKHGFLSANVQITVKLAPNYSLKTGLPGPVDLDTYNANDGIGGNTKIDFGSITPDTSVPGSITYSFTIFPVSIMVISPQELFSPGGH